jgi:undecaprenyl-diphosphatase
MRSVLKLSFWINSITYRDFFVCATVYALLLYFTGYQDEALYFVLTMLVTIGSVGALKVITQVERPKNSLVPQKYSRHAFPSGHAGAAWFTAVALPLTAPGTSLVLWIFCALCALVVSHSRLVLKVHTPLQVLVGALIGMTIPLLSAYAIVAFVGPLA